MTMRGLTLKQFKQLLAADNFMVNQAVKQSAAAATRYSGHYR